MVGIGSVLSMGAIGLVECWFQRHRTTDSFIDVRKPDELCGDQLAQVESLTRLSWFFVLRDALGSKRPDSGVSSMTGAK
jgi:hypothetical protein